jgi:hypothetical protein
MGIEYRTPLRMGRTSCTWSTPFEQASRRPRPGLTTNLLEFEDDFAAFECHSSNKSQTRRAGACDWRPNRRVRSAQNCPHVEDGDRPDPLQIGKSIVHRHQPTTIFGTDRVCDLDYHFGCSGILTA